MPGRRSKKTKGQNKDVSFHFHSAGNSEKGAAYLSEGRNDNPVFSDEFEEDESGTETTSNNITGACERDEEAIQELLESAIDDVTTDTKYSEHPLESTSSDALFEKCEPQTQTDNNEHGQSEDPVETNRAKELEYEETPPETDRFSDSDDFFNSKADDTTLRFNENDRLLDSDDEELFFSLNKPPTNSNVSDENEVDYSEVKTGDLDEDLPAAVEEENLPTIPIHDSSVISSVLVDDLDEDNKALSEVDTHPLIPTEPLQEDDEEELTKDDTSCDTCDQELLMSEEHFTKVAEDQRPKVPPRRNINKSVKVPPQRPPPFIRKGPGVAVRSQDGAKVSQGSGSHAAVKGSSLNFPASSENVSVTKETGAVLPLPIEEDESAKPSGEIDKEQTSSEVLKDYSLSLRYFVIYVLIVFLYYSLNFSSYLAGFLTGFLFFFVTTAGGFIMYVKNLQTRQQKEREAIKKSMETSSQELISQLGMDFDELNFMKSNNFGVRFEYDFNMHHNSDITPAHIKLEDFILTISIKQPSVDEPAGRFWQYFWTQEKVSNHTFTDVNASVKQFDITNCVVTLLPEDIAQNRKRRWSKKYPICLTFQRQVHHKRLYTIYLFSPNAKDKEFWYRQIKLSSGGHTRQKIIEEQKKFYAYMFQYMPHSATEGTTGKGRKGRRKKSSAYDSSVHFSMKGIVDEGEEDDKTSTTVSITKQMKSSTSGASKVGVAGSSATKSTSSIPPVVPDNMEWLNTALARFCWDILNEDHWLKWITNKIQRRISRIKTPSFMEPLSVSEVNLGNDVPIVRRIYGPPSLDYKGVWIYLSVKYKGTFNMTLETKMRLGRNSKTESQSQQPAKPYVISGHSSSITSNTQRRNTPQSSYSNDLTVQDGGVDGDDTDASNTLSSLENSTEEPPPSLHHRSAPRSVSSSITSTFSSKFAVGSPDSELDSGSDDDDVSASSSLSTSLNIQPTATITAPVNTAPAQPPKSGKGWMSMFDRIKNSSIIQKAANTRLVRMAADKMSSYNLYLTVEVKSLEGCLAVNMSPPPSDIIWYGFKGRPTLDLSAKPKLGHREVTIHYVTEWIESKLKEVVEKQLVLPNMESIAIPVLKSAIPEDSIKLLTSPK